MLCFVRQQAFLDHVDYISNNICDFPTARHHATFKGLERAAEQHCDVCERLFDLASVITYPVLRQRTRAQLRAARSGLLSRQTTARRSGFCSDLARTAETYPISRAMIHSVLSGNRILYNSPWIRTEKLVGGGQIVECQSLS